MSLPSSSLTSLTLSVSTGSPPNVLTYEHDIPLSDLVMGNNSIMIPNNSSVINALNNAPVGTLFSHSLKASHANGLSVLATNGAEDFVVTVRKPSLSIENINKMQNDAPFSLSDLVTTNSSGALSFTSSNTSVAIILGSTVTIVGAGTTTINVVLAASESESYLSSTASAQLVVTQLVVTSPFISYSVTNESPFTMLITPNINTSIYGLSLIKLRLLNSLTDEEINSQNGILSWPDANVPITIPFSSIALSSGNNKFQIIPYDGNFQQIETLTPITFNYNYTPPPFISYSVTNESPFTMLITPTINTSAFGLSLIKLRLLNSLTDEEINSQYGVLSWPDADVPITIPFSSIALSSGNNKLQIIPYNGNFQQIGSLTPITFNYTPVPPVFETTLVDSKVYAAYSSNLDNAIQGSASFFTLRFSLGLNQFPQGINSINLNSIAASITARSGDYAGSSTNAQDSATFSDGYLVITGYGSTPQAFFQNGYKVSINLYNKLVGTSESVWNSFNYNYLYTIELTGLPVLTVSLVQTATPGNFLLQTPNVGAPFSYKVGYRRTDSPSDPLNYLPSIYVTDGNNYSISIPGLQVGVSYRFEVELWHSQYNESRKGLLPNQIFSYTN